VWCTAVTRTAYSMHLAMKTGICDASMGVAARAVTTGRASHAVCNRKARHLGHVTWAQHRRVPQSATPLQGT
jgi:hypothetical protein